MIYLFILFLIKNKDFEKMKELSAIKYARHDVVTKNHKDYANSNASSKGDKKRTL